MVPLVGRERAIQWPTKLNAVAKNYHGEIFEGNACRKLLKNADCLNDEDIFKDVGSLKILPFINAFKAMDKLVISCFSTKVKEDDVDKLAQEVRKHFLATGVTESLKIHVATRHIQQCLNFLDGDGLGLWSEQSGESIHHEWLEVWEKFKMNSMTDERYVGFLKSAVMDFSSRHL